MITHMPKQPWLERAKQNLTDLFDGKRKLAFHFEVADPAIFTGLEGLAGTKTNKCAAILNHQLDLEKQLAGLRNRYEMGFEDDFVYSLRPYTGIGIFASPFGCVTEFSDIGDPVTHCAIKSIDDVDSLRVNIKEADVVRLTLDKIKYFLDETGREVPVAFPDIQSPIDVASIVFDYGELMCAMLTEPKKVHALLGMVTDVMIEVLDTIAGLLPDWSPSALWWMPRGIWLSDDLMAVISPEQYAEFAVPYGNRLSDIYGGVFLHSCGKPLAAIDALRGYHHLMGLDFWEVTVRDFHGCGGDFLCSCPVVEDPWHNLDRRASRKGSDEAVKDALSDLRKLRANLQNPILFWGVCPDPEHAQDYYELLCEAAD